MFSKVGRSTRVIILNGDGSAPQGKVDESTSASRLSNAGRASVERGVSPSWPHPEWGTD